ncbi:hypothetical protein ACQ4PT_049556 [Festuca glaucescens]
MSSPLRNGEQAAAGRRKVAGRMGALLLLLRVFALCFSLAAAVFAAMDGAVLRLAPFRFLLAANAIVAVYSAFEVAAAAWEVCKGATLLPEAMQLWFDFGHDQGFGYMALAAAATAAREAAACGGGNISSAACMQADIAVGLGFAAFVFLALAALATGFRLVRFMATGSRIPGSSSAPSSTSPY